MRIALVYDAVYPFVKGGVEKRVHEVGRCLVREGHEVHVIGMQFWDGPAVIVRDGLILHGVCPPLALYTEGRRSILQGLIFGAALFVPLMRERFDIIDCQEFPYFSCITAAVVSTLKRTPLVITWHEVWGRYWYQYLGLAGFLGKCIERLVASIARAGVIAVSPLTAARLAALRGQGGIRVVPNGIDRTTFDAVPRAPVGQDIIAVGRLIPEKHFDILIAAVAALIDEYPDLSCVIIGDGPERGRLQALITSRELGHHVTVNGFLPTHEGVIALLKASRVSVLPSSREGFGMVVLESLACGIPVVTADHPDNAAKDLVMPGTGVVVPLTPEGFAEGIGYCLALGEGMRAQCREAARGYEWERIADLVLAHYYGLAAGHQLP
jgi:glycosyltransferase involved in cell wall biosynthesis